MKKWLLIILLSMAALQAIAQEHKKLTPVEVNYHANGFVKQKKYVLNSGLTATVVYSDTVNGQIIAGYLSNAAKLKFKNNQLVEIYGKKHVMPALDANHTALPQSEISSCSQKGQFKNLELYNGFIYYFDKKG